jgi:hypothetical protein
MQKMYFHNNKSIDQNINTKKLSKVQNISEKQVVDINKLLNRIKIDHKNETKRKIIFYSLSILGLSLLGTLITFLK